MMDVVNVWRVVILVDKERKKGLRGFMSRVRNDISCHVFRLMEGTYRFFLWIL